MSTGSIARDRCTRRGPYRHLFTPLRMGPLTLANRVVFCRPPDQLRLRRAAHRAARRVLRAARGRRGRADHHRGTFHPPGGPALREADPGIPARGDPRLPADHRRGALARGSGAGPAEPQRRPVLRDVLPAPGAGAEPGPGPAVPRGAQGGRTAARSRRSWPATPASPGTARRAGSTGWSCSARSPRSSAGSCPRPRTSAPTATADRWPTGPGCCWRSWPRCARRSAPGARSACGSAATR